MRYLLLLLAFFSIPSSTFALNVNGEIDTNEFGINPYWSYRMNGPFPSTGKKQISFLSGAIYDLEEFSPLSNVDGFNEVFEGAYKLNNSSSILRNINLPSDNTTINGYNVSRNAVTSLWVKIDSVPTSGTLFNLNGNFQLEKLAASDSWRLNFWPTPFHQRTFTMEIDDGNWHHLLISDCFNTNVNCSPAGWRNIEVFVDGVSVLDHNITTGNHIINTDAFQVWSNADFFINGLGNLNVDEFVYGSGIPSDSDVLDYYNAMVDSFSTPTGTLSLTETGSFLIGDLVSFDLSIDNDDDDIIKYVHFYEDVEETSADTTYCASGCSPGFTFTHQFDYEFNYQPVADISNCDFSDYRTGSGCVYYPIYLDTTYVNILEEEEPDHSLSVSDFRLSLGETMFYEFALDSAYCSGQIGDVTMFSGLPLPIQPPTDFGTNSTGSGSFTYNHRGNNNGYLSPFLRFTCDGEIVDLDIVSRINPYSKYEIYIQSNFEPLTIPPNSSFINGNSYSVTTHSGADILALFTSDKTETFVGNEINFKYAIRSTSFPIEEIIFYSGDDELGNFFPIDIYDDQTIYFTHSYSTPGEKYPYLLVKSDIYNPSDDSTFYRIYLGGSTIFNERLGITVGDFDASIGINTNECARKGIFGYDYDATFLSDSGIIGRLSYPIYTSVTYLGSRFFCVLQGLPAFDALHEVINPRHGTLREIPTSIFDSPVGSIFGMNLDDYLILRPANGENSFILTLMKIALAVSIFRYLLKYFI